MRHSTWVCVAASSYPIVIGLDREVERELVPFVEQVHRMCTMPGIGQRTAEIGVDMSRFPTAGHLASWAGLCPGHHESAGKQRSGKARKGNAALRTALCEAAWSAAKTRDTYLAAQFKRFSRRFGKRNESKAIFAVAHTMLVGIWWMLSNNVDYEELGGDYFEQRTDQAAQTRRLVRQLERLGHQVNLTPAARTSTTTIGLRPNGATAPHPNTRTRRGFSCQRT